MRLEICETKKFFWTPVPIRVSAITWHFVAASLPLPQIEADEQIPQLLQQGTVETAPTELEEEYTWRGDKQAEGLINQALYPVNPRKDISLLTGLLRMSCWTRCCW
jgi:hypothetical protein